MNLFTRYTRITNSAKLTDRYLTVQVKESSDPEKSSLGKIFVLVEITNPWYPNSQIGQSIINTLVQEYYKFDNNDSAANFEQALKKVNETLGQIAQKGETDWIGNINSILALIKENEIYLTSAGKAEAILYRNEKTNHIAENNSDTKQHPMKTFSNIISGELISGDKIVFTSPVMFDHLSPKELDDNVKLNHPYEAAQEITLFLKKDRSRSVNAIIIEAFDKDKIENTSLAQDEVVYLDQTNGLNSFMNSSKKFTDKLGPTIESIGKSFALGWDKIKTFIHKEVAPRTKTTWEKTKEISKKGYTHFTTKTAPQIKNAIKPIANKISDQFKRRESLPIEIDNKKPYSVHYYEEGGKKKSNFIKNLSNKFKFDSSKLSGFLPWLFDKKNRSVIYVLIAIILLIILIINIGNLKKVQNSKKQETEQSQLLDQSNSKFEEAKLAILYNDQTKAKNLLNEVITSATDIMKNQPKLADSAKELINKANVEFDKLTSTTRFNSPALITDTLNASSIFVINDIIFAPNSNSNNLQYLNTTDKVVKDKALLENENLTSFGFDNKDNYIYAQSDKDAIYKFNSADNNPEKITLAKGAWEKANSISMFLGSLYLLNSTDGQIYKHISGSAGFAAGTNYVDTSKVDIKNAVSMTIDGSVYILKSDNTIIKLSKSNLQDFNLKDIPTPNDKITKGKKVWTTSEINSLFVLDGNRILELDKTGKFLHQYAFSPDLQDITDFFIQSTEKIIWVLNDKKVYKVSY